MYPQMNEFKNYIIKRDGIFTKRTIGITTIGEVYYIIET